MTDSTKTFKERVKEALLNKDEKQALRLVKEIRENLKSGDLSPDVRNSLTSIKAKLTIVGLPFMSDQTIEQTLEQNPLQMMGVFEIEDLISRFKARLQDEAFAEDRNALRDKWRASLERSQQEVGASAIKLGTQDVRPTVENWLKVYNSEVGSGKVSTVKVAKLFTQHKSLQDAPDNLIIAIRRLFDFVEFLKLRSDQLEGMEGEVLVEDQEGKLASIVGGVVEPVFSQAALRKFKDLARKGELGAGTLIDLKIQYPEMFGEFKIPVKLPKGAGQVSAEQAQSRAVEFFESMKKTHGEFKVDPSKLPQGTNNIIAELIKGLNKGEKDDVKKVKQILANLVKNNEELVKFLKDNKIKQMLAQGFPEEMGKKNKELVQQTSITPVAFQALLQIIFEKKFKLPADVAAWHSFEIVQKFPMSFKEFKTLVTFDVSKNKLAWRY